MKVKINIQKTTTFTGVIVWSVLLALSILIGGGFLNAIEHVFNNTKYWFVYWFLCIVFVATCAAMLRELLKYIKRLVKNDHTPERLFGLKKSDIMKGKYVFGTFIPTVEQGMRLIQLATRCKWMEVSKVSVEADHLFLKSNVYVHHNQDGIGDYHTEIKCYFDRFKRITSIQGWEIPADNNAPRKINIHNYMLLLLLLMDCGYQIDHIERYSNIPQPE